LSQVFVYFLSPKQQNAHASVMVLTDHVVASMA